MDRGSVFRNHSPPAKLIELSLDNVDNEAVIAVIRAQVGRYVMASGYEAPCEREAY